MIERRGAAAFFLMVIVVLPLFFASAPVRSAVEVTDLEIKMPGEMPAYSGGSPVIVRGLIHNISFALSQVSGNITLKMHYGTSNSSSYSDKTAYQWSFNSTSDVWSDDLYGRYIKTGDCSVAGNVVSFHAGISTSAYTGVWSLSIYINGDKIYNTTVSVTDYTVGLAVQSVNTVFTVSPFSSESKTAEYHVRVENKGNIPLKIYVLFGDYQRLFTVTNTSEILHVGEKRDLYITLNSIPWSPRVVNITGVVHPAVPEYLVSEDTVTLSTVADQTFNLRIDVVRQGYNLVRIGNTMVQYRDDITANYGDTVAVDMYLSSVNSTGTAELSISADLLNISSVMVDDKASGRDFTVQLTNDTERHVRVLVMPEKPSSTAYLNYDIRDSETAERDVLTTEIVVGVSISPEGSDGMILLILISIAALFIISIIFITFIHFRKGSKTDDVKTPSGRGKRRRKI